MTERLDCACGEGYRVPAGWTAFTCARCRRVWRRDPVDGWRLGPPTMGRSPLDALRRVLADELNTERNRTR